MEIATKAFRAYVEQLEGYSSAAMMNLRANNSSDPFSLQNWYNVWDEINTYHSKTGGEHANTVPDVATITMFMTETILPGGQGPSVIPSVQSRGSSLLGQITWLAHWLETSKMSSDLVGPLFGGPILSDLSDRMDSAVQAYSRTFVSGAYSPLGPTSSFERLVILSGHYNVQLGILAALGLDTFYNASREVEPMPWITVSQIGFTGSIPSPAAVLAFELHQDHSGYRHAVRAVFQDGPGTDTSPKNYTAIPLPCMSPEGERLGGPGACTLKRFQELLSDAISEAGPFNWCRACIASNPMPCKAALASGEITLEGLASGGGSSRSVVNFLWGWLAWCCLLCL